MECMDAKTFCYLVMQNLKAHSKSLLSTVLSHIAEVSLENDTNYKLAKQTLNLFNQFVISRNDDWNSSHLTDLWDVYRRCGLITFANTLYLIRKLNLKPADVRKGEQEEEISLIRTLNELRVENAEHQLEKFTKENNVSHKAILSELDLPKGQKELIASVVSNCLVVLEEMSKKKNVIENLKKQVKEDTSNFSNENLLRNSLLLACLAIKINNLKKWIENGFEALEMTENRDYIQKDGHIYPVDFQSTGVVQLNRHWGGGIQQFIEMKHRLSLTIMSLVTNFLSNIKFFQRYKILHGVSGTLGSEADKMFMKDMYDVEFFKILSNRRYKIFQLPGIMSSTEREWKQCVCNQIKNEILSTPFRDGRAALVICSDIEKATMFKCLIEKEVPDLKVILYARSDCDDQKKVVEEYLQANTVIVATNLAGRGTDFKVDESVSEAGGLFVLSTFLPRNTR